MLRSVRVTDAAALVGARRQAERAAAALAALGDEEADVDEDDDAVLLLPTGDADGDGEGQRAPLLCLTVQFARTPQPVVLASPKLALQFACSGGRDGDTTLRQTLVRKASPIDEKTRDELVRLLRSDALTALSDEQRALLWQNRGHALALAASDSALGETSVSASDDVSRKLLLGGASHSLAALKNAVKKSSTSLLFEVRDRAGQTVMHVAARANRNDCVRWLVAHKRFPVGFLDVADRRGATSLHAAVEAAAADVVHTLLAAHASVNTPDSHRCTPLHWAARADASAPLITVLLSAGAVLEVRDSAGDSPLSEACLRGALLCVRTLLSHGAKPNVKNSQGKTPLHHAARIGAVPIVEALLLHKAE